MGESLGAGAVIAIVDDGVEFVHEDLAPNMMPEEYHYDFLEGDSKPIDNPGLRLVPGVELDPQKSPSSECPSACHGTAVAGIAAAKGFNQRGVSGVAPQAQLIGYRKGLGNYLVDPRAYDGLFSGGKNRNIDIYNNSYGPSRILAKGYEYRHEEIEDGAKNHDIIYVWGAGNDPEDDTNHYGFTNSRYTITVGGSYLSGKAAGFSTPGATVLVNAPTGGIITTDRLGDKGYNYLEGFTVSDGYLRVDLGRQGVPWEIREPLFSLVGEVFTDENALLEAIKESIGEEHTEQYKDKFLQAAEFRYRNYPNSADYTEFGGTSASAPIVSGVVALMLEANSSLDWRDVQHILIHSAKKNDRNHPDWATNAAGFNINHTLGFGRVDASAAVALSSSWTEKTVAEEKHTIAYLGKFGVKPIPEGDEKGISVTNEVYENVNIEFVEVNFASNHPRWGDLEITLTSPTETKSVLASSIDSEKGEYERWIFGSRRHFGEPSKGEWLLTVKDLKSNGDTGNFFDWWMTIHGTELPTWEVTTPDSPGTCEDADGIATCSFAGGSVTLQPADEGNPALKFFADAAEQHGEPSERHDGTYWMSPREEESGQRIKVAAKLIPQRSWFDLPESSSETKTVPCDEPLDEETLYTADWSIESDELSVWEGDQEHRRCVVSFVVNGTPILTSTIDSPGACMIEIPSSHH